jgi:hypothetical protein
MGVFGSGRHGGTVRGGTASYVLTMSILTRAKLQIGQRRAGTCHFGGERFAVEIKIDTVDPSNPFIELIHQTRDDRKRDRSVRDRIRLVWTVPTYGGQRWWFCAREQAAGQRSCSYRMAAGISGAAKPMASDMLASAKTALADSGGEQRR